MSTPIAVAKTGYFCLFWGSGLVKYEEKCQFWASEVQTTL